MTFERPLHWKTRTRNVLYLRGVCEGVCGRIFEGVLSGSRSTVNLAQLSP